MQIEAKLQALGLVLPTAPKAPPGIKISFAWTRMRGNRIYVSGHSAQAPDGSFIGPFGKVPTEVSLEAAQAAARSTALSMLASLKRELGDLDRVTAWLMVYGMVNAEPGYAQTTNAINGFSDLILDLYGSEVGRHARMAVGMATLPLNNAVTIAAEVEFAPYDSPQPLFRTAILGDALHLLIILTQRMSAPSPSTSKSILEQGEVFRCSPSRC